VRSVDKRRLDFLDKQLNIWRFLFKNNKMVHTLKSLFQDIVYLRERLFFSGEIKRPFIISELVRRLDTDDYRENCYNVMRLKFGLSKGPYILSEGRLIYSPHEKGEIRTESNLILEMEEGYDVFTDEGSLIVKEMKDQRYMDKVKEDLKHPDLIKIWGRVMINPIEKDINDVRFFLDPDSKGRTIKFFLRRLTNGEDKLQFSQYSGKEPYLYDDFSIMIHGEEERLEATRYRGLEYSISNPVLYIVLKYHMFEKWISTLNL